MKLKYKLLLAFVIASLPTAFANSNCPNCGITSNFNSNPFYNSMGYYSMPLFFPNYPWWGGYGAMAYSNFSYPGAWAYNGGGMNGGYYPHSGGGFMGKPNLYVTGKNGTDIKIKVKMAPDSNWLVAVPAHGTRGWHGTLMDNGKIKVGEKETHDFLFYDFRCDENKLQDTAGFCTGRDNIIEKLASLLKQKGFKQNEIRDFETYWSIKLPSSERYCVYPQDSEDLNKIVELEVEPKPSKVIRVAFMIIPDEARKIGSNSKFLKLPQKDWSVTESKNDSDRTPASTDGLEIHEWSVGFIQSQSK